MSSSLVGDCWFNSSLSSLTTVLVSNVKQVKQQENQDWLLFVQQMEAELEGCQFVKVEGNKLYVKQDNQDLAFGLSSATDFRKTNAMLRLPTNAFQCKI